MFQKRLFMGAAALILSAAVVGTASAQAPQATPAAGAAAGAAGSGAAASESLFVVRIDMAGLVKSELYKQISTQFGEQMASKDPNYIQFKQATGFNPETDISAVTIGVAGELGAQNPKMYAIVEGKFDQSKIESYAKSSGKMTVGQKEGLTTFTSTEASGGTPPPVFALVNPTTLVAASTDDFSTLVGSAKSGSGVPTAPALKSVLGKGAKGQIQIAMLLPEQAREQMKANPQSAAMASVQTLALSIDVSNAINLGLQAAADNEANGKNVHDAINGFLALGKMMSAEQPDLAKVLNDLKVEQQGANTQVSLNIKAEDVTKLLGQAMAMASAGMGGGPSGAEGGAPAASGTPAAGGEEEGMEEGGEEGAEEGGEEEAEGTPAPEQR